MKQMKKVFAVVLALVLSISLLPATSASAASSPKIAKKINVLIYAKGTPYGGYDVFIKNPVQGAKIKKIKSSKTSVATVFVLRDDAFEITPVSEGTTKVTFTYAGKKFSTKVVVSKYENPCKEFKIGSKSLVKKFEKSDGYNWEKNKKDTTGKIKIAAKSGWKLVKITRRTMDSKKKVKNNSKITLTIQGTGTGIYADFKNKKTKKKVRLFLGYGSAPIASYNTYNMN